MKRLLLASIALTVATAFTAPALRGYGRKEQGRLREGRRRVGREGQ